MRFLDTAISWTLFLPLCLAVVWGLAEWIRYRRMNALGDARVLGVAHHPWWNRILRILMLCAALACATVVLRTPAGGDAPLDPFRRVVVVLDTGSFFEARQAGLFESDDLVAAIQEVVDQAGSARFTVYRSDSPDRPAVPETEDGQGVLVMISGMEFGGPSSADAAGAGLTEIAERPSDDKVSVAMVVVTSASAENVGRELAVAAGPAGGPFLVRLPGRGLAREFGMAGSASEWNWSGSADLLRKYLARVAAAATAGVNGQSSYLPVQILALVVLAALVGESLLALAAPRR